MHDESVCDWEFVSIKENETKDFFHATWKVTCKCGAVKYRTRAYMKWMGGKRKFNFEHTLSEATELAKSYEGDKYR